MCGIFGIINRKRSTFDYSAFCTLGIANDSRGGDSCGIFIDGLAEYGVGKHKYFEDFFLQSEILNNVEKATIALGHCRKASVGVVNLATAQPVIIQNDNNETEFVVIHNGTIYNYKELAEKYIPDVNINGLTDSQVMARIFYYKGYDVLSEYNGGSVFTIVDYRDIKPKVYFFKGVSKKTEYTKEESEERPLYLCYSRDRLVFSSIYSYLAALCPDLTIYTCLANTLTQYEDGKLIKVKRYDRSNCTQSRPVSTYSGNILAPSSYIGYLTFVLKKFIYTTDGGKTLQGMYYINEWGGVYSGKPSYTSSTTYHFFFGIPFTNKDYFAHIWKLYSQSKKGYNEFINDNELLLRYLSSQPFIIKDDRLYSIKDPDHVIPYTGNFVPIGTSRKYIYCEGMLKSDVYNVPHVNPTNCSIKDINLNALDSLWKL